MIEGQTVSGLSLLSRVRPFEIDQAGQKRGCVLDYSSPILNATTIYDVSGKGNHGTITGATWTRLRSGLRVLSFDGDDFVNCGSDASLNGVGAFTAETWVEPKATPDDYDAFMNKQALTGGWGVGFSGGAGVRKFNGAIYDTDWRVCEGTTELQDGIWYHAVATYNGTNLLTVFVNGVSEKTQAVGAMAAHAAIDLTLGKSTTFASRLLTGYLALASFYNRALDAIEIQSHYQQTRHLFNV